jgi:hypothetical protein
VICVLASAVCVFPSAIFVFASAVCVLASAVCVFPSAVCVLAAAVCVFPSAIYLLIPETLIPMLSGLELFTPDSYRDHFSLLIYKIALLIVTILLSFTVQ